MKYRAINRHIISRYGLPELERRIRQLDIAAIDLDDCIYPRNSHVELTKDLFMNLPYSYLRPAELRLMLKVVRGLSLAFCYVVGKVLRTHVSNRFLLEQYEAVMRNMPVRYFERCAKDLPRRVYGNSRRTLEVLAEHMPTGIITVGFDMIVREFTRQFTANGTSILSFVDANRAIFEEEDGEKLYIGFSREDPIITASDKWHHLQKRLREFEASRPLVIGHRADEIYMAKMAREMGGLSVGFNPDLDIEREFDVIVKARDWTPILELFQEHFRAQMKRPVGAAT